MRAGRVLAALLVAMAVGGAAAPHAHAQDACPWMDTTKSPDQRADEFVAAATDAEKAHLTAATFSLGQYFGMYGRIAELPRLCFPGLSLHDGSAGVAGVIPGVTAWPTVSSQTASWDPELQQEYARALATEHRAKGTGVVLTPAINTVRVPQAGRAFEYTGEDPFLGGKMGAAMARGIRSEGLMTQVKHFALNSQDTNRAALPHETPIDEIVDERVARESELAAFEMAIKEGGIGSVMCAYNKVNGAEACESDWLLNKVLKGEWGFKGFVNSDWGAARSTRTINAGMDMENNIIPPRFLGANMLKLLASGEVSRERLDAMVRRIARAMFSAGLFDNPPAAQPEAFASDVRSDEHRALARRVAAEGTVLLKNQGGVLPLKGEGQKIAVLGSAAVDPGYPTPGVLAVSARLKDLVIRPYTGGGSSSVLTEQYTYPCDGMTAVGEKHGATVTCDGTKDPAAAAERAKAADVAVVFAFKPGSEGSDLADLELPDTPLIQAVRKANPNTVVVLISGNSTMMPWAGEVPAILQGWIAGQEFGNAFADVLFGDREPGGRLILSFLRAMQDSWIKGPEQFPGVDLKAKHAEGLFWGYRWFDEQGIEPLFPFGHGLSYTSWRYRDLKLTESAAGATVSYVVQNTGSRAGSDVGQVYVGFPDAAGEPPQQLKGFQKVHLAPGESKRVTIELDARAFQIWSKEESGWRTVPGCYAITVGRSSRDPQLSSAIARGSGARCATASRACTSRRTVRLHVRGVGRRARLRSVQVFVDGRRQARRRITRNGIRLSFRGRAKGAVRVRVVAVTATGRKVVDRRAYRTCTPRARRARS